MAAAHPTSYRISRFRGRPVIAAPTGPRRVRVAGIARFPCETLKKRLFQRMLATATATQLDFLVSKRIGGGLLHPSIDLDEWLEYVRSQLGCPDLCAVMVWPAQPDRQRVYAHLLRESGKPVAFFKISFDDYNDQRLLNEAQALRELNPISNPLLKVPEVLIEGSYRGHRIIGLEPLPVNTRAAAANWDTFDAASIESYAGPVRRLKAAEVDRLGWWERFWQGTGDVRFRSELLTLGYDDAPMCRVHGDLGTHNMVRDGDRVWIFDWEDYCETAPYLTDELCFFIRLHAWTYSKYSHTLLEALVRRYLWCATPMRRRDVMMALAYLYTAHNPLSTQIIGDWEFLQSYSSDKPGVPRRWMDIDPLTCYSP